MAVVGKADRPKPDRSDCDRDGKPGQRPPGPHGVAGQQPVAGEHRLSAYRGVTRLGALTLASEVCDWRRFPQAAAFTGFCGLVPSEYSSGTSTRRGHITTTGNTHLRAQLVESAWAYQHRPAVGLELRKRHKGLAPAVLARAWAAQLRLCGRFRRLAARKDSKNVVVTAIAREDRPRARRLCVGRDDGLSAATSQHAQLSGHLARRQGGWQLHAASGRRRCRTDPRQYSATAASAPEHA